MYRLSIGYPTVIYRLSYGYPMELIADLVLRGIGIFKDTEHYVDGIIAGETLTERTQGPHVHCCGEDTRVNKNPLNVALMSNAGEDTRVPNEAVRM